MSADRPCVGDLPPVPSDVRGVLRERTRFARKVLTGEIGTASPNPDRAMRKLAGQIMGFAKLARAQARRIAYLENEVAMMQTRTASDPCAGDRNCEAVLVPIPGHLWEHGIYEFDPEHPEYGIDDEGRKCLRLDACIVPAITALWDAGIVTRSCCCGHGNGWGLITVYPPCARPDAA